jgi:hypothetical protein
MLPLEQMRRVGGELMREPRDPPRGEQRIAGVRHLAEVGEVRRDPDQRTEQRRRGERPHRRRRAVRLCESLALRLDACRIQPCQRG